MLVLALAVPALLSFDLIVYDNGLFNNVTQIDVQPDDDIIVRIGPAGPNDTTTVSMRDGATIRDATIEHRGSVIVNATATIAGDVLVQDGGRVLVWPGGEVRGTTVIESGGDVSLNSGGQIGDVDVLDGGEFDSSGESTVAGDLDVRGDIGINRSMVEGDLVLRSTAIGGMTESTVLGVTIFEGASAASFSQNHFGGGLTLRGDAAMTHDPDTTYGGTITLEDTSTFSVRLATSNLGFGNVTATSTVLQGTDRFGQNVTFAFFRQPGATLTIIDESPFGDSFCTQSVPNQDGLFGRILAIGSPVIADDDLTLEAYDLPQFTFAYFIVGTERDAVPFLLNTICVGGNRGRYLGPGQVKNAMTTGRISVRISTMSVPGNPATSPAPGDTYVFQCWHRAHQPQTSSNFTDAIEITFQ